MRRTFLLAFPALAFAALAHAEPPAGPPRPAPELESLGWFLGSWSCTGSVTMAGMGTTPVSATYKLEKDLGGFWIAGRFEAAPSKQNPMPHVTKDFWTYDSASKSLMRVNLDNFGDFARTHAPGFVDGKLAWTGTTTFGPREVPFHETFTRTGERQMKIEGDVPGPEGKPALAIAYTCSR